MSYKKVIVRIKGGLGNQLFGYAAGRRLALTNNAELVIDNVTGFVRDTVFHREYALDSFNLSARTATPGERMEPFERYRRGFVKFINRQIKFEHRNYLEQESPGFDPRLLGFCVKGNVYIDGYWQSEKYFTDAANTIRQDLQLSRQRDSANLQLAARMQSCHSVALHVRWFGEAGSNRDNTSNNIGAEYYLEAIKKIHERVQDPHFFLFSDDLDAAEKMLKIPDQQITCVALNHDAESACLDLWLMTCCNHFIIANSTFSWWGAWLGESESTIVVAPARKMSGIADWGFDGLIPGRWITC